MVNSDKIKWKLRTKLDAFNIGPFKLNKFSESFITINQLLRLTMTLSMQVQVTKVCYLTGRKSGVKNVLRELIVSIEISRLLRLFVHATICFLTYRNN